MPNLDTRTTKTPAVDDYTYLLSNDGTVEGKVELQDITVIPETTRTINFTSSQTAAQIQADIDAVGKYLPTNASITFQFADGTYSLDAALQIQGFYGGGQINIQGNTSETNASTLHTTQEVVLDFKGNSTHGLRPQNNQVKVFIYNLRIEVDDAYIAVVLQQSPSYNRLWYCYLLVNGTGANGYGLLANNSSSIETRSIYLTGGQNGLYAGQNTTVYSNITDDTGTQPQYGLRASSGIIYKSGTQPTGSTGNEQTTGGGQIFS